MKYIVSEIQTDSENNVAILNWQFDSINEADSKYYQILSVAAVSNIHIHAAMIFTNEGVKVKSQSYSR